MNIIMQLWWSLGHGNRVVPSRGSGAHCANRGLCRAWTMGEHGTPGSSDREASEYSPGQVVGRRQVDKPVHAKCARARSTVAPVERR